MQCFCMRIRWSCKRRGVTPTDKAQAFYADRHCQDIFQNFLVTITNRTNTFTGVPYRCDCLFATRLTGVYSRAHCSTITTRSHHASERAPRSILCDCHLVAYLFCAIARTCHHFLPVVHPCAGMIQLFWDGVWPTSHDVKGIILEAACR